MSAACAIVRVVKHPIWLMQKGVNLKKFGPTVSRSSMLTRASVGLCQPVECVYIVGCVSVCEVTETLLAFARSRCCFTCRLF